MSIQSELARVVSTLTADELALFTKALSRHVPEAIKAAAREVTMDELITGARSTPPPSPAELTPSQLERIERYTSIGIPYDEARELITSHTTPPPPAAIGAGSGSGRKPKPKGNLGVFMDNELRKAAR